MALNIDKLEKLAKMKKDGLISEIEFKKLKQEVLNEAQKDAPPKKNITFLRMVIYVVLAIFIGIPLLGGIISGSNETEKNGRKGSVNVQSGVQKKNSLEKNERKGNKNVQSDVQKKNSPEKERYTIENGKIIESFFACSTAGDIKELYRAIALKDDASMDYLMKNKCVVLKTGLSITQLDSSIFDIYVPIRVYVDGQAIDLYAHVFDLKEKH